MPETPAPLNRWLRLTPLDHPVAYATKRDPNWEESTTDCDSETQSHTPAQTKPPRSSKNMPPTPPMTPEKQANRKRSPSAGTSQTELSDAKLEEVMPVGTLHLDNGPETETARRLLPEQPRAYTKKYEIHRKLGHGVWSTVYSAVEISDPPPTTALPPTPPISPTAPSHSAAAPQQPQRKELLLLLAIKTPSRRDARKILHTEARILTYLSDLPHSQTHLVPFHGFSPADSSLIFTAIPLNLDTHIRTVARTTPFTTKTMFDPIVGAPTWASLAQDLIAGLAFLHDHGCVHGDIKPANILLRPCPSPSGDDDDDDNTNKKFTPLYCDFSSSHLLPVPSSSPSPSPPSVSAITSDYTSPELLAAFCTTTSARPIATPASDVFALAVTLLVAAVGESPYAGAQLELQKMAMAREGRPVDFARGGAQGSRVARGRAVEKALAGGLEAGVEKRLGVRVWGEVVEGVVGGWREGGLGGGEGGGGVGVTRIG